MNELDPTRIQDLVEKKLSIPENDLEIVEAGKMSETFFFTDDGGKKVLRVTNEPDSYQKDVYAAELFKGTRVPVPRILDFGERADSVHYAISEHVEGKSSDLLSQSEIDAILPEIWDIMTEIFRTPIGDTTGFGYVDTKTHNGAFSAWKDYFDDYRSEESAEKLRLKAEQIGLDPKIIDKFREQIRRNLPFLPEVRHLWHGDFAFDNLLVHEGKVVAVIDWAQIGYGDWYYDFATMEFWWPDRHGSPQEFAKKYGLDDADLAQRKAAYWAKRFLGTVNFAADKQNKQTIDWLLKYADEKLL